jgi:hypothetical protein
MDPSTMIGGSSIVGAAASVGMGLAQMANAPDLPDLNAISVNQGARLSATALMSQYQNLISSEPLMGVLYGYLGFSPEQIQQTLQQKRQALAQQLQSEGSRIQGTAWESGAGSQLLNAAQTLSNPSGGGAPMPNIPGIDLVKRFDKKFAFNPDQAEDPGYAYQRDKGLLAINRQSARTGMANSGYGAVLNSEFLNQLGAQSYGTNYNRQLGEFNLEANQQATAFNQQNTGFTNALNLANLQQGGNQFNAGQLNQAAATGANLQLQGAQQGAQNSLGQEGINNQVVGNMIGGVSNAITSGTGMYLNNDILQTYVAGRSFGGGSGLGSGAWTG